MSYSLKSLKGGYIGDYRRVYYWVIKGDTRSLDYNSCGYVVYWEVYEEKGSFFGGPILRIVVDSSTCSDPPIYGNSHILGL